MRFFAQADGKKLSSIPLHKVEAHAQGVALCNIGDVTHFLSLTTPISTEGVALLILDHNDDRLPVQAERIRVPAMSATTGEPTLVSAALLQLGGKKVVRYVPTESFALEEIQTKVLKVLVYKDDWNGQWTSFIKHPVKAIFDHTLMQDPAFPQPEHIIDVWGRQTLDAKMARTQTDQAEIFAFLIRVTEGFAAAIMPSAAVDGIYLEPRTLDGRKPDPSYRVIWMPRQNLAQVRLARSQTEAKTTIARMGNRFGLRVDRHQASMCSTGRISYSWTAMNSSRTRSDHSLTGPPRNPSPQDSSTPAGMPVQCNRSHRCRSRRAFSGMSQLTGFTK